MQVEMEEEEEEEVQMQMEIAVEVSALEVAVIDEHEAWPEERHRQRLDLQCSGTIINSDTSNVIINNYNNCGEYLPASVWRMFAETGIQQEYRLEYRQSPLYV